MSPPVPKFAPSLIDELVGALESEVHVSTLLNANATMSESRPLTMSSATGMTIITIHTLIDFFFGVLGTGLVFGACGCIS